MDMNNASTKKNDRFFLLTSSVIFLLLPLLISVKADELMLTSNNSSDYHYKNKQEKAVASLNTNQIDIDLKSDYENEVHCLALNIYFEARGESEVGQRAVGHVVMNRVAHPNYPSSVCDVVRQGGEQRLHRCQFSWWCDGRSDKPLNQNAWNRSMRLARRIYFGFLEDTTDGALWYHATSVTPYWSKSLLQGSKIGQHVFYLENQQTRNTL